MKRGTRITGGVLRGRIVATSGLGNARYTASKVRGAIFNRLGDVEGLEVLDLFAGAGTFSCEALSRAATAVTSVETDREMASIIRKNAVALGLSTRIDLLQMDVRQAIPFLYRKKRVYDIIFMDPPYEKGLISETLRLLRGSPLSHVGSTFVLEHRKKEVISPVDREGWHLIGASNYGDTIITMLREDEERRKE